MSRGQQSTRQFRELNESILNHLFLPLYLPSSAEADFCSRSHHRNEYMILECMNEFLNAFESIHTTAQPPVFQILNECTQRWSQLQKTHTVSALNLQSMIQNLPTGSFLPLYFYAQNAAILIEIDENNDNQAIISSWQVQLPSDTITSSLQYHQSTHPVTRYRLSNRSYLNSSVHCELLIDFMNNTIEYSKTCRSTRELNETRDVPMSHYVCHWWIQQFSESIIDDSCNNTVKFAKKHRDQVRSNNAQAPFRRSGLWMTMKVVFQTILTKRLGNMGTVIYKLLITHFLTYIICKRHNSADSTLSIDLLVHCVRKIIRRLNKIEHSSSSTLCDNIKQWMQLTKHEIRQRIDEIFPRHDWQMPIRVAEEQRTKQLIIDSNLNLSGHYQHACESLKSYLKTISRKTLSKRSSKLPNIDVVNNSDEEFFIPSFNFLTNQYHYTIGTALTCMEYWIMSWLEQWINQLPTFHRKTENFQMLSKVFHDYQQRALQYYSSKSGQSDPIGYSRFIITSLTIIRAMHQQLCHDQRFERLQYHCIDIPNLFELFEYLILPNREDMMRARDLYDYFKKFRYQPYPDLLTDIAAENSFGVHFAAHSTKMNNTLRKIQTQAEQDKAAKIQEVRKAKERYHRLMTSINGFPCTCYGSLHENLCRRCRIESQANNIEVDIYECPIPSERASALAVMFELRMPIEVRCYRDLVWNFVNRSQIDSVGRVYEWLKVRPHSCKLEPFYTGPIDCQVKLVSATNSLTQSHIANPDISSADIDDFLYENSLEVSISPTQSIKLEEECWRLTPHLNRADYKYLQYTVESTKFMQNQVIADLSHVGQNLKPNQYIEFGTLRSGHRLQWWNILAILEADSLPLNEESVAVLINHAILQYGPMSENPDTLVLPWCPESHQQLLDDQFLDEILARLHRHLDDCTLFWQNEYALVVITIITMRIVTICNSTQESQVIRLALKCRDIGEKWIKSVSTSIETVSPSNLSDVDNLRSNLVLASIACLLTFSTHIDRHCWVLSSSQHVISLLKSLTIMNENINLRKTHMHRSAFLHTLIRFIEHSLVRMQPTIAALLRKSSYQSLNEFSIAYWAVINHIEDFDGHWTKRNGDIFDGWYDGRYESTDLSINCLNGTFLVNDISHDHLPKNIISNDSYIRVFEHYVFQVQMSDSPNTYITKYSYHGDADVQYEFHFDDQHNCLIVHERHLKTGEIFELIPPKCFETELPFKFVSEYSHWKNLKYSIVEFRPVHFQDPDFLKYKPYVLDIETGYLSTTETSKSQILINQSSSFCKYLFQRYFMRLDDQPYVYMMRDHAWNLIHNNRGHEQDIIVHIYLSRLAIAFTYDASSCRITSHEYSDMCVDENQWIGTLTGLNSGLVLSSINREDDCQQKLKFRKLIVPFGYISAKANVNRDEHQLVTIQRSLSMTFTYQYFVFVLNDRLRIIQSNDCPSGWLYLALLHAMTSHILPDEYTGMTGMERALQLLNSAGCWTDQRFDSLSLNILHQIATISPKATYYRQYLFCTEKIDWNSHTMPYSLQHSGYYLIVKQMIATSENFNFMHPSQTSNDVLRLDNEDDHNTKVLTKLYWDYRDTYSPIARLSNDVEIRTLDTNNEVPYRPVAGYVLPTQSKERAQLVNDLYARGDVFLKDMSKFSCFPLSQWLTDEYSMSNIWVGLLKRCHSIKTSIIDSANNDIQRMDLLLDFLLYISSKREIRPIYLQMLRTILHLPDVSLGSITFPPFTQYNNIQHITVTISAINFHVKHTANERKTILEEVRQCFEIGHVYKDHYHLASSEEKHQIKFLLKSWELNRKLHTFLIMVQNLICSSDLISFNRFTQCDAQVFTQKFIEDQYHIVIQPSQKQINQDLLLSAQRKYHDFHSDYFPKPKKSFEIINQHREFPNDIFSSVDDIATFSHEIQHFFKTHLAESWKQLQSTITYKREYPVKDELIKFLRSLLHESEQYWSELIESITNSNEKLFQIGLLPRTTPTVLISLFQEIWLQKEYEQDISQYEILSTGRHFRIKNPLLTIDQCTLLGGLMVNWVVEQQIERALLCLSQGKQEVFEQELSNVPHVNWIPSKYLPWLIFELERNITIREIQVDVAHHMMQIKSSVNSSTLRNIVMQMNMGEGKTSVIIPMLAVSLCSPLSSIVRIVILKSLFPTNYQSLKLHLGALLNRRIFTFACRRDMNFINHQVNQIFDRLQQALRSRDVLLVSPEDILSFDLLTLDKCRQHDFDTARSMLNVQRWLKIYVRDVLDESDEILHHKYQLIYTVGHQQQVDGGVERWKLIQWILSCVKKYAASVAENYHTDIKYKSTEQKARFPEFRLLSHRPFSELSACIANHWISQKSYRKADQQCILSFLLDIRTSIESLGDRFSPSDIQLFLIIRGLLSSEVLYAALTKRYRVNYGIAIHSSFKRLMAVPFRAKDVPAERTEFGHPDIALVLTQLSYYYSGLSDCQILQCFDRLNQVEPDPETIYVEWMLQEDEKIIPQNVKQQWKRINLKDCQQEVRQLFFTLRYNTLVIDYFLNHFVFPHEVKQFPNKLVASAWDLSSAIRTNAVTGFSGTNDTQLLLPVDIHQSDLAQLQKTDALVISNLLHADNENYRYLSIDDTTEVVLCEIANYEPTVNVILDVGALLINCSNREIAVKWLQLADKTKIDYAVYFEFDCVVVCDRQYQHHSFLTSPASERLNRCVFYLDEVHTRGTDFKFPCGFKAVVTLGNGLTKDRLVQACMRMRSLGHGHSLIFWSSNEVHQHIVMLKKLSTEATQNLEVSDEQNDIQVKDILRWVYQNTQECTWDGLHYWAIQSLSFQRKISAFQHIKWADAQQILTDQILDELAINCLEPELIELKQMYGQSKILRTLPEIYVVRYQYSKVLGSEHIHHVVLERLRRFGGSKLRLSQFLDEEQQRELEQELEQEQNKEEEQKSIRLHRPCIPKLHDEIRMLCNMDDSMLNLTALPAVFRPLKYAFSDSTIFEHCNLSDWLPNLWISTEFQRVIENEGDLLDQFLRPPRWLIVYRNEHIIFVSAFEANWLMGRLQHLYRHKSFKEPIHTSLRMLLPRLRQNQSIFVNLPKLTIPPLMSSDDSVIPFFLPTEWLVTLYVFNGTMYFDSVEEQTAYCQCLALCPKPRTVLEENAFENDWIDPDGFIKEPKHRDQLLTYRSQFHSNPLVFIRHVLKNRNHTCMYRLSHVESIVFNGWKLLSEK